MPLCLGKKAIDIKKTWMYGIFELVNMEQLSGNEK